MGWAMRSWRFDSERFTHSSGSVAIHNVDYRVPILETLTAYVRERTRDDTSIEPPVDVREIMKLLSDTLSDDRLK